jgi:uncharacterized DUF497 family protein
MFSGARLQFEYASLVFGSPTLEVDDERADYGEWRIQVIGRTGNDILFVVYTWRGDNRRIISARRAKRSERRAYRQIYG